MLASDWAGPRPQWRQLTALLAHAEPLPCHLAWLCRRARGGPPAEHASWLCRKA